MTIRKKASVLLIAGLFASTFAVQAAEIIQVETAGARSQSVLGSTVIPYKEVTLSAQIPGVVKYVAGAVGTNLTEGAVVFKIDEAQLTAKRNAVVAQISIAQAGVQNAQAQYYRELTSPRSKDVGAMPGFGMPSMFDRMAVRPFAESFMGGYDSDTIRQGDLTNAMSAVSQAQGQLQQAMSQLQEIDSALRDASALAPFEGIILEKMVEVGDTVQPGQPLVKYGYVKYKRLQADVPSGLVGNLSKDMLLPARIDGSTDTSVRVSEIYPIADPSRHTVTVKFDIPMEITTAPGMYAEIYVPENKKGGSQVTVIPRSALMKGSSLPGVLVVKDDNTSELRMVRLGAEQNGGSKVAVISGLNSGEKIINNPPAGVTSGWMPTTVNPAPAPAPTPTAK
ncbi:efflux RND transporter periplasmic adaptor subunit [Thiothrix subterranea]|uniref:Efflux RND transporter periplasmic adaptor subunit n=1 Tax=Thiothrix subterranea TaxID=2735563 RepID=A0AA51MM32_9GAMM|nr:efflux RND transporter periplasmic adaptor subunit [Thiothrix subterranea]MDQ5767736.1 efflux RND transporter periplasmic adaptor subunit [Thiothrix subterranea]QQZ30812.1 efflux RND transporter periplasmic adaptor subunit [Thiothrix subterranea]WML85541.1 efflux RND transporter periplasmic adaptor subunit [Thiothrix subterranea]